MLRGLLTASLVCVATFAYAQARSLFSGVGEVTASAYVGSGEYEATVTAFRTTSTIYSALGVQPGYFLWTEASVPGVPCARFRIESVDYRPDGTIDLRLDGDTREGSRYRPKVGRGAAILEHTEFSGAPAFKTAQTNLSGYVGPVLSECIVNDAFVRLDSSAAAVTVERSDFSPRIFDVLNPPNLFGNVNNLGNFVKVDDGRVWYLDYTGRAELVFRPGVDTTGGTGGSGGAPATVTDAYFFYVGVNATAGGSTVSVSVDNVQDQSIAVYRNRLRYDIGEDVTRDGNDLTFSDGGLEDGERVSVYVTRPAG